MTTTNDTAKPPPPNMLQKVVAEAIGTFMVTLAAIFVDVFYFSTGYVDYVSRWVARGFITASVIYAFSDMSGAHVNPAITFGFWLRRLGSWQMFVTYVIAQFAGAFAAAALALRVFGPQMILGASHPGPHVSALTAMLCEIVLTFIVMLVILMTAHEEATIGKQAAVAVGFAVAACGLFAGPISGASMNPARSIAPQVLGGAVALSWIYAVGPLAGSGLAAGMDWLLQGKPNVEEREAATGKK